MIKCDTLRPVDGCCTEVEGPGMQILAEANLLFERLLKQKKLTPAAARWAVESAIEICKLGEDSRDQKKYFAACDAAIKRTGFDWGEFIKECGDPDFAYLTREARTSAAQKKAPTIEVHVIKL